MISILIATKNRADRIISCAQSVLQNTYDNFEIIIVDQSNDTKTCNAVAKLKAHAIKYFKNIPNGKSAALNFGIQHAKGDIIAFTDDDCIVSRRWIYEVAHTFERYPETACVTGNTYPYKNIPSWASIPTISTNFKMVTKPVYHPTIGFGNNFAIKKSVFKSIGLFSAWLGPGTIGRACEDGEIIIRMLLHGHTIIHNPKMIVYHNKKLEQQALKKQNLSYICGEMACYGYYSLSGYAFARNVIIYNFLDSLYDLKRMAGDIVKRKVVHIDEWQYSGAKFLIRIWGHVIGLYYYSKEVI